MANIGKKGLDISTTSKKNGDTEVSTGSQTTGLTERKFNLLMAVSIGFGVASLLAMLAMLSTWLIYGINSFNEYSNKRYEYLEKRIIDLENKQISTQSAK